MAPAGEGAREGHPPWPCGKRTARADVTTSGREQQESLRRSTREQAEHENERVDDRRPRSSTCGEGSLVMRSEAPCQSNSLCHLKLAGPTDQSCMHTPRDRSGDCHSGSISLPVSLSHMSYAAHRLAHHEAGGHQGLRRCEVAQKEMRLRMS